MYRTCLGVSNSFINRLSLRTHGEWNHIQVKLECLQILRCYQRVLMGLGRLKRILMRGLGRKFTWESLSEVKFELWPKIQQRGPSRQLVRQGERLQKGWFFWCIWKWGGMLDSDDWRTECMVRAVNDHYRKSCQAVLVKEFGRWICEKSKNTSPFNK